MRLAGRRQEAPGPRRSAASRAGASLRLVSLEVHATSQPLRYHSWCVLSHPRRSKLRRDGALAEVDERAYALLVLVSPSTRHGGGLLTPPESIGRGRVAAAVEHCIHRTSPAVLEEPHARQHAQREALGVRAEVGHAAQSHTRASALEERVRRGSAADALSTSDGKHVALHAVDDDRVEADGAQAQLVAHRGQQNRLHLDLQRRASEPQRDGAAPVGERDETSTTTTARSAAGAAAVHARTFTTPASRHCCSQRARSAAV